MAERFKIDRGPSFISNVEFQQDVDVKQNLAIKGIPNVSQSIADNKDNASPGGGDTQVQFNNKGNFSGSTDFTFNPVTKLVTLNGSLTGSIEISAQTGSFDLIDGGSF